MGVGNINNRKRYMASSLASSLLLLFVLTLSMVLVAPSVHAPAGECITVEPCILDFGQICCSGVSRCNGNTLEQCSSDGKFWTPTDDCSINGPQWSCGCAGSVTQCVCTPVACNNQCGAVTDGCGVPCVCSGTDSCGADNFCHPWDHSCPKELSVQHGPLLFTSFLDANGNPSLKIQNQYNYGSYADRCNLASGSFGHEGILTQVVPGSQTGLTPIFQTYNFACFYKTCPLIGGCDSHPDCTQPDTCNNFNGWNSWQCPIDANGRGWTYQTMETVFAQPHLNAQNKIDYWTISQSGSNPTSTGFCFGNTPFPFTVPALTECCVAGTTWNAASSSCVGACSAPNRCMSDVSTYSSLVTTTADTCASGTCGACIGLHTVYNSMTNRCECDAANGYVWDAASSSCIVPFTCTGSDPAGATLCPGSNTGLTANTAKTLGASCDGTKCQYTCSVGTYTPGASPPSSATCCSPQNGVCNNNAIYACTAGTATNQQPTGAGYSWNCSGVNACGASVSCHNCTINNVWYSNTCTPYCTTDVGCRNPAPTPSANYVNVPGQYCSVTGDVTHCYTCAPGYVFDFPSSSCISSSCSDPSLPCGSPPNCYAQVCGYCGGSTATDLGCGWTDASHCTAKPAPDVCGVCGGSGSTCNTCKNTVGQFCGTAGTGTLAGIGSCTPGTCLKCDATNHFVYDTLNNICVCDAANGYVPSGNTCIISYTCTNNPNQFCAAPTPPNTVAGSGTCASGTSCFACNTAGHYILNALKTACILDSCTNYAGQFCSSSASVGAQSTAGACASGACYSCNAAGHFILNSSGNGCTCDAANGYILNASTNTCILSVCVGKTCGQTGTDGSACTSCATKSPACDAQGNLTVYDAGTCTLSYTRDLNCGVFPTVFNSCYLCNSPECKAANPAYANKQVCNASSFIIGNGAPTTTQYLCTFSGGSCSYTNTTQTCSQGCTAGACNPPVVHWSGYLIDNNTGMPLGQFEGKPLDGIVTLNLQSYTASAAKIEIDNIPSTLLTIVASAEGYALNTTAIDFSTGTSMINGKLTKTANIVMMKAVCMPDCSLGNRCDYQGCSAQCAAVDPEVQRVCNGALSGSQRVLANGSIAICCNQVVGADTIGAPFSLSTCAPQVAPFDTPVVLNGRIYHLVTAFYKPCDK